jgi:hypothetical protein
VITDLPLFDVGSVKRTVGQYETASGTLPIAANVAPADWQRATMEGASHLWLLADNPDDPAHGIPIVGFLINRNSTDDSDAITLDLATIEAYLDRRYVGDKTYVQVGQNAIVADLINSYILDGAGGLNGIPIRVQYTGAGTLRDRSYLDLDDKTVYSVLTALSGVIGGPEFSIGGEWQHNPERITPVLYVGDRVGVAATAGLSPAATFEMPGGVTKFKMVRDYSASKGATSVMAVSTANGNVRPQSAPQVAVQSDRPTFELRYTPSTSITDVATLNGHAQAALKNVSSGAVSVALSAIDSTGSRLGVDWSLGDDVGFGIGGTIIDGRRVTISDVFTDVFTDRFGADATIPVNTNGTDSVPAFPGGIQGTARAISWLLTLGNTPEVTPTLTNPVFS